MCICVPHRNLNCKESANKPSEIYFTKPMLNLACLKLIAIRLRNVLAEIEPSCSIPGFHLTPQHSLNTLKTLRLIPTRCWWHPVSWLLLCQTDILDGFVKLRCLNIVTTSLVIRWMSCLVQFGLGNVGCCLWWWCWDGWLKYSAPNSGVTTWQRTRLGVVYNQLHEIGVAFSATWFRTVIYFNHSFYPCSSRGNPFSSRTYLRLVKQPEWRQPNPY